MKKRIIQIGQTIEIKCDNHGSHIGEVLYRNDERILIDLPEKRLSDMALPLFVISDSIFLFLFPILSHIFIHDDGINGVFIWVLYTLGFPIIGMIFYGDNDFVGPIYDVMRIVKEKKPDEKQVKIRQSAFI